MRKSLSLKLGVTLIALLAGALVLWSQRPAAGAKRELAISVAGRLKLVNSRNRTFILRAANLGPGQLVAGNVALRNRGTVTGRLILKRKSLAGSLPLAGALRLVITQTRPRKKTVYSGTVAALSSRKLGRMAPGNKGKRTYRFAVTLMPGAADDLQSQTTVVSYYWKLY
jgi:hypothetical protein